MSDRMSEEEFAARLRGAPTVSPTMEETRRALQAPVNHGQYASMRQAPRWSECTDQEYEHLRPSIQEQNRRDRLQDMWCRAWPFLAIIAAALAMGLIWTRQDPQRDASAAYEAAETLLVDR